MAYQDDELKAIKQQVDRNIWRIGLLGAHFIAWVVGSALVGVLFEGAVAIVAPAWFGLILLHGLLVFLAGKRDRDIEAELERRRTVRGEEKLKRDRLYRLSDDGELVEVEDDALDDAPVRAGHL